VWPLLLLANNGNQNTTSRYIYNRLFSSKFGFACHICAMKKIRLIIIILSNIPNFHTTHQQKYNITTPMMPKKYQIESAAKKQPTINMYACCFLHARKKIFKKDSFNFQKKKQHPKTNIEQINTPIVC
jgi:hypothetical protein